MKRRELRPSTACALIGASEELDELGCGHEVLVATGEPGCALVRKVYTRNGATVSSLAAVVWAWSDE